MLTHVDRVQVAVTDRSAAAAAFRRLLDGETVGEDRVSCLGAQRTLMQLGASQVELLEPDGAGPIADFVARTKGGLFAAGVATRDLAGLRGRLRSRRVAFAEESGQVFLAPDQTQVAGLRLVVSQAADLPAVGLVSHLYEVTLLVPAFQPSVTTFAGHFGLEPSSFVPIGSPQYGYEGVLTLFHPDRPDRLEIITPNDPNKTMGRFFAKRGPSLYMCYAETDHLPAIRDRLLQHVPNDWTGPREGPEVGNLFIHPNALGGMMLGVSRTSLVWSWSGRPDRVTPGAGG
jgi:hypothetical protein